MKRTLTSIGIILLVVLAVRVQAQVIPFSQFYTSSLFLNPSFAGIPPNLQVSVNHRRQVQTSGRDTETSQFSLLYPFVSSGFNARQFGGIGVTAYSFSAGDVFKNDGFMVSAAYNLRLGDFSPDYVIFGLQGGYSNQSINYSNLQWGSQYTPFLPGGFDPNAPDPSAQFNDIVHYPLVNVGLTYYFNPARTYRLYKYSAFSGFSFKSVNRPNISFMGGEAYREPMLLTYHGGMEFSISHKLRWSPHGIVYYSTDNRYQFNIGNYMSYSFSDNRSLQANNLYLTFGVWYRVRDGIIATTGFTNNNLQVAFSYDLNKGYLFTDPNESFAPSLEISLTYTVGKTNKGGKSSNPLF
jgi:type IX secretion system PorP/SprF family membrane protein